MNSILSCSLSKPKKGGKDLNCCCREFGFFEEGFPIAHFSFKEMED
jgi:hypothetical protein